METLDKKALQGGEWLVRETDCQDVFTPEEWTEEQQMIAQTCRDFIAQEVSPNLDRIDSMEEGLMKDLMDKAGELGLLAITVPENYGGMGASFNTSCLVAEATGMGHSFSVAISAHTGIGTLPIQYYGNEDQRSRYLPGLGSGELKAAYALTEPSSGSDANSGKTKAVLSEDGKHYILNGQKMWITNAGFADVFTVFAKIDDDKNLSAFIVDGISEGLTLNAEEKKLGIKGSSTRQVFFNNVKVPVENLLSDRGNGFKIAVNILNIGRIKLGAAGIGGGKQSITQSVNYANEREQFGRPISNYGAIQHKLAQQAILTWVNETATYRAGQDIENCIDSYIAGGMEPEEAKLKGVASYAVECAMLKVFGSEAIDYIVDEAVQIYGGMGFSAEAPVERAYRDARINRIFEGTNEINRMLTVDMMLKKAMKGELDLMGSAQKVVGELMSIPEMGDEVDSLFGKEKKYLKNFKKAALMVAGSAAQKLAKTLSKEQEVLMNIADMLIAVYTAESALLRAEKMAGMQGEAACASEIDMVKVYFNDTADNIWKWGKDAITSFADGDELKIMNLGIKRFTKTEAFNTKDARRRIAQVIIDENKYPW
jgi:alkylation response protein AidB-like acyl-CoA dehydrogenase